MSYGQLLRREVGSAQITTLIGIFAMYSASVAARHYGGLFVSGFGFAASHYGRSGRGGPYGRRTGALRGPSRA
jgi:hypothetical protein